MSNMDSHWMDYILGTPTPAHMQEGADLVCLYPSCGSRHADEVSLDLHIKTHFETPTLAYPGCVDVVAGGSTLNNVAFDAPVSNHGYTYGGTLPAGADYGRGGFPLWDNAHEHDIASGMTFHAAHPQQSFGAPTYIAPTVLSLTAAAAQTGKAPFPSHGLPIAAVHPNINVGSVPTPGSGLPTTAVHPNINVGCAPFPGYGLRVAAAHPNISLGSAPNPSLNFATPTDASSTISATSTPSTPHRHVCLTCSETFTRPSDLARHALKHDPQAKRYECTFPGCKYVGAAGFTRKDKLTSHMRARHGR